MKLNVIYPLFLFSLITLASCKNRNFETEDQFRQWIAGKTFTSIGNDLEQWDSKGTYHQPLGSLELKFNGNEMTYPNCSPQIYTVSQDYGTWIVGFKRCDNNDDFELVIPQTGDMYLRSLDYDLSKMEEGSSSSAVNKLDAIVSKQVVRGPNMTITDEHDVTQSNLSVDSNKMEYPKRDTVKIVKTEKEATNDTIEKPQVSEMQPVGNDTTELIVQTETEKGDKYAMSDKLPLSYQYGNTKFTFSKTDDENSVKLDCYNENGLYSTVYCLHQGVFLYVSRGMQDIFTCTGGKVIWHNGNRRGDVQLYEVK